MCRKYVKKFCNNIRQRFANTIKYVKKFYNNIKQRFAKTTVSSEVLAKEEFKDYIYLSSLTNLFKKYAINLENESAIFKLRDAVFEDGKKFAKKKIIEILTKDINNIQKAECLLREYEELKKNPPKLEFQWAEENKNSPRIYWTAFRNYLEELDLVASAKNDFKDVFPVLINKVYNLGFETIIERIKINIEFLEEYHRSNDIQNIMEQLTKIEKKLKLD